MNGSDFEHPPTIWVVLTVVGGIVTGLGLIASLEYLGDRLLPDNSLMLNSATISVNTRFSGEGSKSFLE